MATKVFINLGVKDLNKTKHFFEGLGFSFNPQFSDENAACMIVSDTIYVMMLTEPYFKTYTKRELCDTAKNTQMLIALDASSREEVDATVTKAASLGATLYAEAQDHGWMYQRSFADPNGHQWEFIYMDEGQLSS